MARANEAPSVRSVRTQSENERGAALTPAFFARNTLVVARALIGKIVEVRTPEGVASGRIVETEAYRGDDPASHSCRGETPRSAIMFGPPAMVYVYFIYGMYEMLNFVTEPRGKPGAVLIRAVEPVSGLALMSRRRRGVTGVALTSGPGKVCRALGIELAHNGASLQGPAISVRDDGYRPSAVAVSPRVGIRVGTEALWRYFETDNPYVSRCPQNREAR